ncbi:MAG: type II toxin-antitoxin system VapC family toxin [Oceanipulchritudo sp.]
MRIFCDTSVLVAGSLKGHPHFPRARLVLTGVSSGKDEGYISVHSIAECYSALTTIPLDPPVTPLEAERIIRKNLLAHFQRVPVTEKLYSAAIARCASLSYRGGILYGALLLECARKSGAERIYTLNLKDFTELAPDLGDRICAP